MTFFSIIFIYFIAFFDSECIYLNTYTSENPNIRRTKLQIQNATNAETHYKVKQILKYIQKLKQIC